MGVRKARADGAHVTAQVAGRPVGIILGLTTSLTPFAARPTFAALLKLPLADRLAKLRDPVIRAKILNEESSEELLSILPPLQRPIATRWDRQYVLGDPPDYEPDDSRSIAALAAKTNLTPEEFCYDYLTGENGDRMLFYPVTHYVYGDHGVVHQMITDPDMLTHWARDRARGGRLPVEFVVKRLAADNAAALGLNDRGRLKPGLRADINVIDFDHLAIERPSMRYDLPAGGKRLVQLRGDGAVRCRHLPRGGGDRGAARPSRARTATGGVIRPRRRRRRRPRSR